MRHIPILSTLVVLLACALMVGLGFWQLERRREKEALLAHYAHAQGLTAPVAWNADGGPSPELWYRRTSVPCASLSDQSAVAGRSRSGTAGFAATAQCHLAGGGTARVVLGWTEHPDWKAPLPGGVVSGVIAPGPRLVADPPLGGLGANALPDPADLPNNHLSYAIQWFLFALTALVIYALALRKRLRA
ncbi:SURF1 family protein [Novosphingobium sp. 1949]|uniref:SURF1-like protein n=1 Tax=Novosphingobium organovorum TaxID=2930092 RepID=A0ABT0BDM0_9SPHN|nr:SURF1 family protein [Novosphingobium organovorum]MCJ2183162.1 SURF1 family protein [Novosphingobium organovorum]